MHLVFENAHGWKENRVNQLEQVRSIIVGSALCANMSETTLLD
jgi:hypothetical protein